MDVQMSAQMSLRRKTPERLAADLASGLAAILEATQDFMKKPPRVEMGLDALGKSLLEVVTKPVKESFDGTDFAEFEKKWMQFFDKDEAKSPRIFSNITRFSEDGEPDGMVEALTIVLTKLSEDVAEFTPQKTSMEVDKFLDTLTGVLDSLSESWDGFEDGEEVEAVETLYKRLKKALDEVLQPGQRKDETYNIVITQLDSVMKDLGLTVTEFQKQQAQARACFKETRPRKSVGPKMCDPGFTYDGEKFCHNHTQLAIRKTAEKEALALMQVDGAVQRKKPPKGARPAKCDPKSNFPDLIGHKCFENCPTGFAVGPTGKKCKTTCKAELKFDDGEMCGLDEQAVDEARRNQAMAVVTGEVTAEKLLEQMKSEKGIDEKVLAGTVDVFVGMAKPFEYQTCP
jgi:hypothetical protein